MTEMSMIFFSCFIRLFGPLKTDEKGGGDQYDFHLEQSEFLKKF